MLTNSTGQYQAQAWSWEQQMNHQNLYYRYEKEHMFEKPLTPSDVGKLNRLVIPKQYAERYFPLDADSGEKGLLLSFEDESSKEWRFRYSYWTSSQSYVLTKGWSRYVKEKRLDAGDVVMFERICNINGGCRLYIGCRKQGTCDNNNNNNVVTAPVSQAAAGGSTLSETWSSIGCYNNGSSGSCPPSPHSSSYNVYSAPVQQDHHAFVVPRDQRDGEAAMVPPANSKRLRLFGVNLDCVLPEPEQDTDGSVYGFMSQNHYTDVPSIPNYWRSS